MRRRRQVASAVLAGSVLVSSSLACSERQSGSPTDAGAAPAGSSPMTGASSPGGASAPSAASPDPTAGPGSSAATTPASPPPPRPPTSSVADRFDAALGDRPVFTLGTPAPEHVRDSVARLSLLTAQRLTPAFRRPVRGVTTGRMSLEDIAAWHMAAPDRVLRPPGGDGERFVRRLHGVVLGRRATAAEVHWWTTALAGGGWSPAGVAVAVTGSDEAVELTGTTPPGPATTSAVDGVERGVTDSVLRLHLGLLRRFPTVEELEARVARYVDGEPLAVLAAELLESPERTDRLPPGDHPAFVTGLYEDVLGREPDPGELDAWLDQLAAGVAPGGVAVFLTESDEAIARTHTAEPMAPSAPVGPGVVAVGDSVMLGAAGALQSAIPGIGVDAAVSRQFADGTAIVQSLTASGSLPGTLVVHLGTNGPIAPADCDALMAAASGARVVLVTVSVPRTWEASVNAELAACAGRHGAVVADWNAVADGVVAGDGFHVGAEGATVYADLVASTIGRA